MAHRLFYEWFKGAIPKGLQALHHCDNPPCVNPDHIFLGTNQDNVDDKMRKGRHVMQKTNLCKKGHPLITVAYADRRICPPCRLEADKRYREKHASSGTP